jgi:cytochrome c2
MRRILVVASAVAFLAGAGSAFAQDAKKIEKGKEVFAASKCSMCHSIAGKGNPKGPLDDVATKVSAAEMKQWLNDPATMAAKEKKDRKPQMKSFKTMSAEDQDALIAYLQTLKKK